jgi:hypothetical protein
VGDAQLMGDHADFCLLGRRERLVLVALERRGGGGRLFRGHYGPPLFGLLIRGENIFCAHLVLGKQQKMGIELLVSLAALASSIGILAVGLWARLSQPLRVVVVAPIPVSAMV